MYYTQRSYILYIIIVISIDTDLLGVAVRGREEPGKHSHSKGKQDDEVQSMNVECLPLSPPSFLSFLFCCQVFHVEWGFSALRINPSNHLRLDNKPYGDLKVGEEVALGVRQKGRVVWVCWGM